MSRHRYYHGRISRDEAVDILTREGRDGSFLLRMSETQDGVYTLSIMFVVPPRPHYYTIQCISHTGKGRLCGTSASSTTNVRVSCHMPCPTSSSRHQGVATF